MKNIQLTKFSKKKVIVICLILLILIAIVVVALIGKSTNRKSENTRTVEAVRMSIENTLDSEGEIISSSEEEITPHTSYYLKKIKTEEGEGLEEGDVILTYTNGSKLTAPYNCVVESWNLPEEGEQLTDEHYVKIAGTDVMQMEVSVNEEDVSKISLGNEVTITVEAVDSQYDGEITYISEVGTYSNGNSTFTVKVTFDSDEKVKLGMNGAISIILEKAENVIAVPSEAVSKRGNESFVTVMNGDESETITVETGINNDSYIEITSGLDEGTKVVVKDTTGNENSDAFVEFGGFGDAPSDGGNLPVGEKGDFGGGDKSEMKGNGDMPQKPGE